MRTRVSLLPSLLLVCLAAAEAARAEALPDDAGGGTLFLRTAADAPWTPAPMLETDVVLRVTGTIVRARVEQRFRNPGERWMEGVYVFPLPEMAAVDHLDMRVGQRVLEGRTQERKEAKRTYQRAREEGRKASLVEQERPNVFTTSVANLGPGEEVVVALQYQETLRYEEGGFALRFPTVVAPRYVPGAPLAPEAPAPPTLAVDWDGSGWAAPTLSVPDAPRITPPVLHPDDGPVNPVRLRVELDAGLPLGRVESPSHVVHVESRGGGRRLVELADFADRDFVLEWEVAGSELPRAAVFAEEAAGGGTHVLLVLMPPDAGPERPLTREVVFVIDVSGSMSGPSIEQARAALLLALERLSPGDHFNVIRFDDATEALFEAPVPVDRTALARARRWVEGLRADGGTVMLPAVQSALASDTGRGDVRQVVFVTDGSIGNEAELFAALSAGLGRSRLFTVGIGSAPNGHFLARAAKLGRGTHTFIANPAEVDEKMGGLFRKLESPVLSDLEVVWKGPVEMWPERIPDLYRGEPVVVTAHLPARGPRLPGLVGEVGVRGRRGGEPFEAWLPAPPPAAESGIAVLWARRKIAALMDGLALGADAEAVRREVVAVALEHHLVSKYTSLVAVDVTPTRPRGEGLERSAMPTNLPAGWDAARVGGVLPRTATPAPLLRAAGLVCLALGVALVAVRRPTGEGAR